MYAYIFIYIYVYVCVSVCVLIRNIIIYVGTYMRYYINMMNHTHEYNAYTENIDR